MGKRRTQTVVNRERSGGRELGGWVEQPPPKTEGMEPGTKCYLTAASKCSVLRSRTAQFGWHISIAHPWRRPTWDEIASARYALVPADIVMVMVLPPEDEYVNVHEYCFHLWECRCPR